MYSSPDNADNLMKSFSPWLSAVLSNSCSDNRHWLRTYDTVNQEILKTRKNDLKPLKNKNLRITWFLSISRNKDNIFKSAFLRNTGILIRKKIWQTNTSEICCSNSFIFFCVIFQWVFVDILREFPIFL